MTLWDMALHQMLSLFSPRLYARGGCLVSAHCLRERTSLDVSMCITTKMDTLIGVCIKLPYANRGGHSDTRCLVDTRVMQHDS